MTKTILCALDVSQPEHDANVLKRAGELARLDKARLDVITVVPDFGTGMVSSFFPENFHEKALEETHKALDELVESVLGAEFNKEVRHVVVTGNIYEEVLQVAETDGADLIVIGSHRPGRRGYLLGPNSARVVRHAHCSVYVVR